VRTRRFLWLIVLVILLSLSLGSAGLGDQVETKDGRLFKGTIQSGVPDLLSIDEAGIIVNISKDMIKKITKEVEGLVIETATDDVFRGALVSDMPSKLVIKTQTGIVEIREEDIATITFPRKTFTNSAQPQEIELKDGRQFGGRITAGIPDPLTINVASVILHIERNKIREIRYEEQETIIETVEDEVLKGQIVTAMPEEITLQARYGTLEIKQTNVVRILFKKAVASNAPDLETTLVLGGQLSMMVPISELIPMLSLGIPLYGVSIEVPLAPRLGARAEVGYSATSTTFGTNAYNLYYLQTEGKVILYLLINEISPYIEVRPYIGVGVGFTHISLSTTTVEASSWTIAPIYSGTFGVSLSLPIGFSTYIQAELPYVSSPLTGSSTLPLIMIGVGMSYSF
jgi:hypothetical protein